jgi:hypothetical protein
MLKNRAETELKTGINTGFLFFINTPAQVHFWKNIIRELESGVMAYTLWPGKTALHANCWIRRA